MFLYGFDPLYLLYVGPAILLAMWAQFRVKSVYAQASRIATRSGMTGAEAARRVLNNANLDDVGIEESQGMLSDHYDPRQRVLRLSPDVYHGRSLASVGIAAHESGHAIQHGLSYGPLKLRNFLVPAAATGGQLSMMFIIGGMVLMSMGTLLGRTVLLVGIGLFGLTVVFQLINLPVEFDASRRAKLVLVNYGVIDAAELPEVKRVLDAAAVTYVAATLTAIMTLIYYLVRSGVLSGGRRE